jgi:hypothetical protein
MSKAKTNDFETEIEEGDVIRFEETGLGYDLVDEGEVIETPPWTLKIGDSVLTYNNSVRVRVPNVGYLPVSFEHIHEVVSE